MTGQFVRALGTVYHLDCFRCQVRWAQALLLFHEPSAVAPSTLRPGSLSLRGHELMFLGIAGLQQGRRVQVLPRRRGRR